ncbi:DUF305 domain-containing protein [Teichococcus aerofrigidensis]
MPRPHHRTAALLAGLLLLMPALATAQQAGGVGRTYDPEQEAQAAPVPTTWWDILPREAAAAAIAADRDYVEGMRPHHAGALTLARDYLADPDAASPVLKHLAQAIITNQGFEILLLDTVAEQLRHPPTDLFAGLVIRPVGVEGLGPYNHHMHAPAPGPLAALNGGAPISARDVRFAKEMSVHHQAAVRMARAYNGQPEARNDFLRLLNVNILRDQTQEIAVMRGVIDAYPGDASAITIDPDRIPGMQHMQRHASHG